jgi:hypothetical protein
MGSKRGKYMQNSAIIRGKRAQKEPRSSSLRERENFASEGGGNKYSFGIKIYAPAITRFFSSGCANLCRHWSSQKGYLDLQGGINGDYRTFFIQIFGGNAVSSIQSSLYCVLRSLLAIGGSRAQFGGVLFYCTVNTGEMGGRIPADVKLKNGRGN